ncbi:MAG: UrcA family protein [Alphaproteobacteria bacterium]
MTNLKLACAGLAAIAAVAVAPAALAEPQSIGVRVDISDLNLNSPQGVTALYQRINAVANEACYDHNSVNRFDQPGCKKRIVSNAVASLKIPALGLAYRDAYKDEPRLASR